MPTSIKPQWFHILLAVADGPLHGTAIMEEVLDRTDGEMKLWPGTLYNSLGDLEERGWVQEVEAPEGAPTAGGKRRFYAITADGRQALAAEAARLEAFAHAAATKLRLGYAEPT